MLPKRKYHPRNKLVHGFNVRKHPLYTIWSSMMRRCYVETDKSYVNYGGRGIKVADNWHCFENFANDMGLKPTKFHSLERVNNDEWYSKFNCMWATRSEQSLNRRVFKNNTSGATGVIKLRNGAYLARYNFEKNRYVIGRFLTKEEAISARRSFVELFKKDREKALKIISEPTVWNTSSTKIRGISKHPDGGYMLRVTENKKRIYLGYFKNLEDAENARREYYSKRN